MAVSNRVLLGLTARPMATAVDLDHEPLSWPVEIDREVAFSRRKHDVRLCRRQIAARDREECVELVVASEIGRTVAREGAPEPPRATTPVEQRIDLVDVELSQVVGLVDSLGEDALASYDIGEIDQRAVDRRDRDGIDRRPLLAMDRAACVDDDALRARHASRQSDFLDAGKSAQTPEVGRGPMTQQCSLTACQNRGEHPPTLRDRQMADCVDASVKSMQMASSDPSLDHRHRHPARFELTAGHDAVLSPSKLREGDTRGCLTFRVV